MLTTNNTVKVDKGEKKLIVNEVRVVRKYPGIFLDDLSNMPLEQEVEFIIDLTLKTIPISKAPYRITTTELQEGTNRRIASKEIHLT